MGKNKLDIHYLAQLANLTLGKKEKKTLQGQLEDSVGYIKVLEELKTSRIKPAAQVTNLENIYQADETKKMLSQEQALSSAKKKKRGYFVTKRVKWE